MRVDTGGGGGRPPAAGDAGGATRLTLSLEGLSANTISQSLLIMSLVPNNTMYKVREIDVHEFFNIKRKIINEKIQLNQV